ncbi:MAG: hypothetical protein LAN71_10475 [Acidobacteriia bacterium]|nr:hypothetical protein [Terriglobia bacterium]
MDGWNYFSYYSEIEEYFWKKRGAHLLVSPIDWAIMESWQQAGVPLSAVCKGIDRAFESYQRSRRGAGRALKSLAYCTDAVLEAAEEEKAAAAGAAPSANAVPLPETFSREALRAYFQRNVAQLRGAAERVSPTAPEMAARFSESAQALEDKFVLLDAPGALDLEDIERHLTVLDEKLQAALASLAPEDLLLRIRRDLDHQLAAYRGNMKGPQLAQIERQFIHKRLLEEYRLPRLSLYYFS